MVHHHVAPTFGITFMYLFQASYANLSETNPFAPEQIKGLEVNMEGFWKTIRLPFGFRPILGAIC